MTLAAAAPMSTERAVATAIIRLMQGVVYREHDEDTWSTLERQGAGVRDHFATIGVDVVVDDAEGYAYLRSRPEEDGEEALPRLVRTASAHLQRQPAAGASAQAARRVRDQRR